MKLTRRVAGPKIKTMVWRNSMTARAEPELERLFMAPEKTGRPLRQPKPSNEELIRSMRDAARTAREASDEIRERLRRSTAV